MPLTDAKIRAQKPAKSIVKLSDGGGLQLWISPANGRVWHLAYRFEGKQKRVKLGEHSTAFGLAEARAERDKARKLLAEGRDPSQQKALDKLKAANNSANTFAAVAAEVLEKKRREGRAAATLDKLEWLYGIAGVDIGKRPVADITAPEVLAVLRKVEKAGKLETARKLRSVVGEVFRYAIATGRAETDPTQPLKGALTAPVVKHRAALTEPKDVGALMRAIDAFQGQPTTVAGLKLLAYLFPRPGELRQAEWSEFDLDGAVWTIPASRAKMRREHRVPLPRQVLAILADLQQTTGRGRLVLPGYGISGGEGRRVEQRPISENTLNVALRRMGYTADQMTSHGFRATASTLLNESGKWSPDAIERALAHQDDDAVRRAYSRGAFWTERVAMAQWWADELDRLKEGGKVISLVRA